MPKAKATVVAQPTETIQQTPAADNAAPTAAMLRSVLVGYNGIKRPKAPGVRAMATQTDAEFEATLAAFADAARKARGMIRETGETLRSFPPGVNVQIPDPKGGRIDANGGRIWSAIIGEDARIVRAVASLK